MKDKKINKKISIKKKDTIMLFSFNSIYFKLILTYTKIISQYLFLIWFMFLRHSVLIIIWKICSRLSMVILQCWRWGVTSVGSVRCSHHKVQLKTILEPSLLQRQSGAWQTIQNVIETNIDARKYKWIAIIKFSLQQGLDVACKLHF